MAAPVVTIQPGGSIQIPQNVRPWSSGLCGCFEDCGSCICAMFCLPCMLCQLASRLNETCCVPYCYGQMGVAAMRVKLRTMYGIQGSICGDICATCWCGPCVACQMSRELDAVGL
ncbi:placenta-specific gene 8 protein-like [Lingula anatina]|uniref:Placenta-specific gene 8 protein-like n=1 Tax=Lingula anatina TaxID=7574 RepID=A0A1S3H3F5_LINAN|nr:placenta-specific gene 8 protein-like [Lingula anatina]XP_013380482.1 placenta-specific gene 8 protein-like [Lingula anatina]|eukprot:XP_013380481.1 placenta-specific gene 8 protein-like [Lingula anatina]